MITGSERASQTHADGGMLKEGCHINLSMMTLTTVIRKLRSESTVSTIAYFHMERRFTRKETHIFKPYN
jgi:centromeric protein E